MKIPTVLGGLALALGLTLPVAAEPPDVQVAQAQPAPGPQMGHRPEGGRAEDAGWVTPDELDGEGVSGSVTVMVTGLPPRLGSAGTDTQAPG